MVVPYKNAFRDVGCPALTSIGASSTVLAATNPGATLNVQCSPVFTNMTGTILPTQPAANPLLMVSNSHTAALLTVSSPAPAPGSSQIKYKESGGSSTLSDSDGGYAVGDQVYPAYVVHYFVSDAGAGGSGLFRELAVPQALGGAMGPSQTTLPFKVITNSQMLVGANIEDFQVQYSFDTFNTYNPNQYSSDAGVANWGYPPLPSGSTPPITSLRAVTIWLVGKATTLQKDSQERAQLNEYGPVSVGNHVQTVDAGDGYQRNIYTRTVELTNLAGIVNL
jgi:hypothetical protein